MTASALESPQCVQAVATLNAALAQDHSGSHPSQAVVDAVTAAYNSCSTPTFHASAAGSSTGCSAGDPVVEGTSFSVWIQGFPFQSTGNATIGYHAPTWDANYTTTYKANDSFMGFRGIDGTYGSDNSVQPYVSLGTQQFKPTSSSNAFVSCADGLPSTGVAWANYTGAFVLRAEGHFG